MYFDDAILEFGFDWYIVGKLLLQITENLCKRLRNAKDINVLRIKGIKKLLDA